MDSYSICIPEDEMIKFMKTNSKKGDNKLWWRMLDM